MGAAASTARDELSTAGGLQDDNLPPLKCKLSEAEVQEFANTCHFTPEEIIALHIHFDMTSAILRDDGLIDSSEFQTALGFPVKESLYVDRIFRLFDTNNDSFISFSEFLQSVVILSSKGKTDDKLRFSFNVLDLDNDSKLSKQELLRMLESCILENSINIPHDCLEKIVDKTIEHVDMDRDGFISFEEYKVLADFNPSMLSHLTFNISGLLAEYLPTLRAVAASRLKPAS
ncbi:TPA: hypothetical protein N0F65_000439 [Lagenidium giganteum]|uniref:EF-hand domain-containing protein n=1 Tax=Lagenidium giganteum TaxID=4803 RepID=A0AAV2YIX2_9STRA|nr:TPA: hypothetical protein N0F65_000439 [Lagenidium giganteum]